MLSGEKGVLLGSDYYFMTPSSMAQEVFFYPYMCGQFRCITGYDVKREDYSNYLLMYVAKGRCKVEFENREYDANEGALIFLNCHKPHRYYALDYLDIIWLHFDGHDAENMYQQIYNANGLITKIDDNSIVITTIKEILIAYRNNQRLTEADFSWKIYRLLCHLLATPSLSITPSQRDSINQAIAFIDDHYCSDINLADVAAHINMSVYHFSRLFKKKVGQSPYHYILILRINKAKTLLKSTTLSVKEIAVNVGFNSESNFNSAFSEKVGIPPQKFREFPL